MSYTDQHIPDQSGRTVLITGGNAGIGFAAARLFAQRNARVLLGCRDAQKGEAACQTLVREYPRSNIELVSLDLADLSAVRAAAARILEEPRLDILVNNAGVMVPPRTHTSEGFELQFGVNHLGHFALTGLLLPRLLSVAGSRVVTVSSLAHRWRAIDFEDLHAQQSYRAGTRYGMSKLANLLFSFELQRRLRSAGASTQSLACHPGAADTQLFGHVPIWLYRSLHPIARRLLNSATQGALPLLRAATDIDARGGDYFGPSGPFELVRSATRVKASATARNAAVAGRLWDVSVELTGVEPEFNP